MSSEGGGRSYRFINWEFFLQLTRSLLADESPGIAMATSATTLAEPQRGEDRTEESTATANTRFWATVDKPPHNKYNH